MATLRDLFNEHKWSRGDLARLRVVVRHRGAEGDERRVGGADIVDVQPDGLVVEPQPGLDSDDVVADGAVFLPYHRIVRVEDVDGTVIWRKVSGPD